MRGCLDAARRSPGWRVIQGKPGCAWGRVAALPGGRAAARTSFSLPVCLFIVKGRLKGAPVQWVLASPAGDRAAPGP